jgi:2-phospho-L-lactate guanylyltransferase (CobY/MobA/RfbA family)
MAEEHLRASVADRSGTGTTLLTTTWVSDLYPGFGADSAARHRATGAVELTAPGLSLRQDVDELRDLEFGDGVRPGRHTETLLASCAEVATSHDTSPSRVHAARAATTRRHCVRRGCCTQNSIVSQVGVQGLVRTGTVLG